MISNIKNKIRKLTIITIVALSSIGLLTQTDNTVFSATNSLLEGKATTTGDIKATDNNNSTGIALPTSNGSIRYDFNSPVNIDSWSAYTTASSANTRQYFNIKFYDENNNIVADSGYPSGAEADFSSTPTLKSISAQNVKYIIFRNPTGAVITVNEFDVFGSSVSPIKTTTATASLIAGGYELTAPDNVIFGETSIGMAQSLTKALGTVQVADFTGSGKGWRLQVQATPFSNGLINLPASSLQLKAPLSISALNGETSNSPTIQTGYPWFIDAGSDVTILSAALNEGMGSYSADFSDADALTFTIPSSAKAGNYSSTITWKMVVGP